MRKVPQKKQKTNKFIFPFVIILILVTIFLASFIISYNVMSPGTNNNENKDNILTEEYEQPEDMLSGSKTEDDRLAELRKENAKLKSQISQLEVENAELRNELETMTATLENQSFVQQNASSTTEPSVNTPSDEAPSGTTNTIPNITTSETGL